MLGTTEILIIAGTAIFLFGGAKVVSWARNLGEAKRAYEEEAHKNKNLDKTNNA